MYSDYIMVFCIGIINIDATVIFLLPMMWQTIILNYVTNLHVLGFWLVFESCSTFGVSIFIAGCNLCCCLGSLFWHEIVGSLNGEWTETKMISNPNLLLAFLVPLNSQIVRFVFFFISKGFMHATNGLFDGFFWVYVCVELLMMLQFSTIYLPY